MTPETIPSGLLRDPLPPGDEHLRPAVDELDVFRLASRGFRLFPVRAGKKEPLIPKWQERATQDLGIIRGWLREYLGCNWGLACGAASGVFVLDVDGKDGAASIGELCREHGQDWMDTLSVSTARGHHLYFQYPVGEEIRNSIGKLKQGLDIRGDGGYVVVPPSIHPSGHEYAFSGEHASIPTLRVWFLKRKNLDFVRIGRCVCVTDDSIERLIAANTIPAREAK